MGFAALFAYDGFSAGLLLGIDTPLSGQSNKWYYANKPWIGLGFGYKIFGGK
ncbi:hypothetical protein [Siphonobacter sp. SORGH_AS_0500]|uniref:hypothetical protein n=1 Tax=Siphonobacter sp. SORGH_AS_0500 TaxID=1864824 RepID=UPI0012FF25A6|nr:hypothetical protein [Siphonobacter sp. SORGH_AS_0500]